MTDLLPPVNPAIKVSVKPGTAHTVLGEILAGCRRMLNPQHGRLVMTVRPYRQNGRLINLPGQLEQLAADHGLELCGRHAALLCGLNGHQLVPRASFFQIRIQRSGHFPHMLIIAHEDVLVFKPASRWREPER